MTGKKRTVQRNPDEARVGRLSERILNAQKGRFEKRHEVGLLEPYIKKDELVQIGLRLTAERPHYAETLEEALSAIMLEHELHTGGEMDELSLLRKVMVPGAGRDEEHFGMDRLRTHLPEFPYFSSIGVNSSYLRVSFTFFFDLERVKKDLKEAGYRVTEEEGKNGKKTLVAVAQDGGHFRIGSTYVSLDMKTKRREEESLTRFVEFIAATQFKPEWCRDNEIVNLNKEVKPILELMLGDSYPRNRLGSIVNTIFKIKESGEGFEGLDDFAETRRSMLARAKSLRGEDEKSFRVVGADALEHIDYIVVKMGKETKVIAQFDCEVDVRALEDSLRKLDGKRLFLTSPQEKRETRTSFVNKGKGRGAELRKWTSAVEVSKVLNEEGCAVLTFKNDGGKSTFFVPLSSKTLWESLRALDMVYDEMMFYTTTGRNKELGTTGLTPLERQIAVGFRNLTHFYRFFLEIEDAKRAYALGIETGVMVDLPSARKWVLARMAEAGEGAQFHEMILHAINCIDARIDPNDMKKYGGTPESEQKARELYAMLHKLKGRFEAMAEVY